MSLEDSIAKLITALETNTRALLHAGKTGPVIGADPAVIVSVPQLNKPPAEKGSPEKAAKDKPTPAAAPAVLNKDGEHPDYVPLKAPFLHLVETIGRDNAIAAIAPLKALNEVKAGEQKPGQYAELAAKIKAATEAAAKKEPALV